MSKIIGDTFCPTCRSEGRDITGNHLILYEDGGSYCNRCGYTSIKNKTIHSIPKVSSTMSTAVNDVENFTLCPIVDLLDRGLTLSTAQRYQVRSIVNQSNGTDYEARLLPLSKDGKITGYKKRDVAVKSFSCIGDCKDTELFGQSIVPPNGKKIFITEGEYDAMSLYQVLKESSSIHDWEPPVLSLSKGSASAAAEITKAYDYLDTFEQIIFVFDQDEAGKKALDEACMVLPHKSYTTKLTLNDPNEMLMQGLGSELKWACMKHFTRYQPDNIVDGADTWEAYKDANSATCYSYPPSMPELNAKTYGVRLGSIVTVTSGSGCGKTQFMRELKYHFFKTTKFKIADIALEEGLGDTVSGIMSVHLNKRLHLPDITIPEQDERDAHSYLFDSHRWSFYDHFGGMDDSNLFNKIRYFAATGHNLIFLDHLSIIVSEYAAEGNERERIDTIMSKLAKLAKELDICIFLVVHLRKTSTYGSSFEEGLVPSLDDLRGSGSLKQLSWDVIALSRNQQHYDNYCANTSLITVLKCRFTGRTGPTDYLHFVESTGRMVNTDKPENYDNSDKDESNKFNTSKANIG